ncbi:MAG: D-aminoacyl-tRNA deacylase [Bacteroidales bacterium]|jgi:D-tyrosyl-tRNA(Tyr) deacylase|nr:D-aminoacyl-tRNA deacylase [Bacteroidales bacterium]
MRVVVQRVKKSSVKIDNVVVGKIDKGMTILVAIEDRDNQEDIEWITNKIINLRIFDDSNKVMNLNVKEVNQDILVVSQFTLYASTKKGNRPSYLKASKPEISIPMYEKFIISLQNKLGKTIPTGKFGADMEVEIINDGPVTIIIDSKLKE